MALPARRIGILAGGGALPLEFAKAAAARGELALIVALDGAADVDFGPLPVERAGMGQVGRILRLFRSAGARDIIIIGPASRPDLKRLKLDAGFFFSLPAVLKILAAGGDDGVLSGVVRFLEAKGFNVLGPADVAPQTLASPGTMTRALPDDQDKADIALGFEVIGTLGSFDVGQAVAISGGRVIAIEGAEGTDRMLQRLRDRMSAPVPEVPARRQGVLVKCPKPGQELRVDMPSIGPGTIDGAHSAGVRGIALRAGNVLVAERDELVRRADAADVFVVALSDEDAPSEPRNATGTLRTGWRRLGRLSHREKDSRDIELALRVMTAARHFECGTCIVVRSGHVLAVEAGHEGAPRVLERVRELRGTGASSKRAGVAVLSDASQLDARQIASAAAAGMSGLAIVGTIPPGSDWESTVRACNDSKLFLLSASTALGGSE